MFYIPQSIVGAGESTERRREIRLGRGCFSQVGWPRCPVSHSFLWQMCPRRRARSWKAGGSLETVRASVLREPAAQRGEEGEVEREPEAPGTAGGGSSSRGSWPEGEGLRWELGLAGSVLS